MSVLLLASLSGCAVGVMQAASYHNQQQNHFDPENHNTWRQAYYVNDTFWSQDSDAPVFLCVGGEGPPLDGSAVRESVHCNIAVEWLKSKGALMFALEHRYYGCHNMSACPVTDLTRPDSLKFLSSRQAVGDIASFVSAMNDRYQLEAGRNKWITWGGSYPGMLAAWSRLKHPELIHAAVSSSAPVSATLDMPEYMDHMAVAYGVSDNNVGGSKACSAAIRDGHAWIEQQLASNATSAVEQKFGLPQGSLATLEQRIAFAASGVANFPAQENDPLCQENACNIAKVCKIMTNSSFGKDAVDRLVHLRAVQSVTHEDDFQNRVRARWSLGAQHAEVKSGPDFPDFWVYQTCKEFGFYQTCEFGSNCMFVRGIMNVSYFVDDCYKQFNFTLEEVAHHINGTNRHYGDLTPTDPDGILGRCVVWPNGEVDPWSTRSVLKAPSKDMPTLYVAGASHHSWTWPSRSGDQESVMAARAKIREQVDIFLNQDCSEGGSPKGASNTGMIVAIAALSALVLMITACIAARKCRRSNQSSARLLEQQQRRNPSGVSMT